MEIKETEKILLWILTTNSSGKTTFCKTNNQEYKGIILFDTDIYLRPINKITGEELPLGQSKSEDYRIPIPEDAINFLRKQKQSSYLLTSMVKIGLESYKNTPDINVIAVIIPKEQLKRNVEIRNNQKFEVVSQYQDRLIKHALQHKLSIYTSFQQAIKQNT